MVETGGLEITGRILPLIQINNLTAHGTTSKWRVLSGLANFLCNSGLLLLLVESIRKHFDNAETGQVR